MANQQGNFGFRPVQMLGGAYFGQGQQEVSIASNETNSIFQGDPVVLNANGSISRGSSAGAELLGIFNGCFYTCLLYTSPSPRDGLLSRMPSSA